MENDPSPFPEFRVFQPVAALRRFAQFVLRSTPTPLYLSEHYNPEHFHGAAVMLDEQMLQDQEDLQTNLEQWW